MLRLRSTWLLGMIAAIAITAPACAGRSSPTAPRPSGGASRRTRRARSISGPGFAGRAGRLVASSRRARSASRSRPAASSTCATATAASRSSCTSSARAAPPLASSHAASYEREGGKAYWSSGTEGVEEWLFVVAPEAGPVASWQVAGATLRPVAGAVELADANGTARLRVSAPAASAAPSGHSTRTSSSAATPSSSSSTALAPARSSWSIRSTRRRGSPPEACSARASSMRWRSSPTARSSWSTATPATPRCSTRRSTTRSPTTGDRSPRAPEARRSDGDRAPRRTRAGRGRQRRLGFINSTPGIVLANAGIFRIRWRESGRRWSRRCTSRGSSTRRRSSPTAGSSWSAATWATCSRASRLPSQDQRLDAGQHDARIRRAHPDDAR